MRKIPKDMICGSIFKSNNCGEFVIDEYESSSHVVIRFTKTGHVKKTTSTHIRNGSVKDPYHSSVYGVGFVGVGSHSPMQNGKLSKAYTTWNGMLERCYANLPERDSSYRDCVVCDDWHNFQGFAEWFSANYVEGYHLDKDIAQPGSKIYSPETCSFVPPLTNILEANTMKWEVTRPDGSLDITWNLKSYCAENGLIQSHMYQVAKGTRRHHKNFRVKKLSGPR